MILKSRFPFSWPWGMKFVGMALALFSLGFIIYDYLTDYILDNMLIDFNRNIRMLSFGLMMVFFSRENDEDERIELIKYKSLAFGFFITFILHLIVNYSGSVSSYIYIITTLLISIICFQILKLRN
jgi:hypothetical protein